MKSADLHVHTVYSDGTFTPRELVVSAEREGIAAVAVVDHDTVDALPFVLECAQGTAVEIVPGIELSAESAGTEYHILGYFIHDRNPSLLEKLNILKVNRVERIYQMTAKLRALGVALEADDVFALSGEGTVGRLHVARALLKLGAVATTNEAFQRYIGDRSPAYVLGFKFSPREAISLIKSAGGIPVLAHPYTLRNDTLILDLISEGLMGLEVYYPEHSQSMVNYYLEMARANGLLVTGGSDCHGAAKPGIRIGAVKIPYELLEEIKHRLP